MLKTFKVNSEIFYFNSDNFTLSTSPNDTEAKTKKQLDRSILKKVVINISNSCNLSCIYCFADGGNYGKINQLMSITTANRIIEYLNNRGIKCINRLILFGGEPFLNIDLFIYIIEKISKTIKIKKIETVTNGTVLNKKVKSMISIYKPYLTVSLDGPELIHNKLRGRGSHKKTCDLLII